MRKEGTAFAMDPAAGLAFAADGLTAAAATFNAAWLWGRAGFERAPGRRWSLAALGLLMGGVAVQAVFAQAMYSAHRFGLSLAPFFAAAPWLTSRLALAAGTLALTALILRRRAS